MKITCPECQATYKIDLPDPDEAGIDVQCGKCLEIFLFTSNIEKTGVAVNQTVEPIIPPQKGQNQEIFEDNTPPSQAKKQVPSSPEIPEELEEELELELIPEDPGQTLEEQALDEIWDQAVEEGTRSARKTEGKTPTWEDAFADQALVEARWRRAQEMDRIQEEQQLAEAMGEEYVLPTPPSIEDLIIKPPAENRQDQVDQLFAQLKSKKEAPKEKTQEKKSQPLPSLEERQREIFKMVEEAKAKLDKELPQSEKSQPLPSLEERQREIFKMVEEARAKLEEEAMPSWEDAFEDQSEVEKGWGKTKIKRTPELKSISKLSIEERQREIDLIIASHRSLTKGLEDPPPKEKSQPLPSLEERQQEIFRIVEEAKAKLARENPQEEIDLEEEVTIDEDEALPSWEDAFSHQAEVEAGWRKAQEQDRIQEEQQLAEAMGEEYVPSEPAPEETPAAASQENQQGLVDDIFTQIKNEQRDEIDKIFSEAKAIREDTQEAIDLEEEVTINEDEALPSWEDAFSHQAEVETGWRKAQEQDRIQEEQQLAEAMGEEYVPSEPAPEETTAAAPQENQQGLVDDIFTQIKNEQRDEIDKIVTEGKNLKEEEQEQTDDAAPDEPTVAATPDQTAFGSDDPSTTAPADMDMKQLVEQAFKEESGSDAQQESPVPEAPAPIVSEPVKEPEPTLASAEATPEPEPLTMEPLPELVLESAEDEPDIPKPVAAQTEPSPVEPELTMEAAPEETPEPEPVEAVVQQEPALETELEPALETKPEPAPLEEEGVPEMAMEIEPEFAAPEETPEPEPVEAVAQQEPEPEPELEPALETELEPAPLEEEGVPEMAMEIEPELEIAAEPSEPEASAQAEPSSEPEATFGESAEEEEEIYRDEELWSELFPDQKKEGQPAAKTVQKAPAEKEESFGGDFWDQVLEKETEKPPPAGAPAAKAAEPVAQGTPESEALTDEELWAQAFPEDEEIGQTTAQSSGRKKAGSKTGPAVDEFNVDDVDLELDDEQPLDLPEFDEETYDEYGEESEDFEYQRRKRKLGPFVIPHGRRGNLVIGGVMVVFLLIAGSIYFTLQTFVPSELNEMQTAQTDVPEGLTPREVPLEESPEGMTSPEATEPEKTPAIDTPGDKGSAVLSEPSEILKESPEEETILKDLAESQILRDTGKTQTAKIDQSALQAFSRNSVTLSTIMPVAYNPTDIRVLSFSVEIQLSDTRSAKMVRESLPVYEEIMNRTVEDFLQRKFYNDILYVKEKLQKRLQTAMNKSLRNGRVKKTKFTDFAIQ